MVREQDDALIVDDHHPDGQRVDDLGDQGIDIDGFSRRQRVIAEIAQAQPWGR